MADGMPLHVRTDGLYQFDPKFPTMLAYAVDVARARERVVEGIRVWKAARNIDDRFAAAVELDRLINVLDAAEGGAGK